MSAPGQNRRGQSTLEYAVLVVIIIGVFLATQQYIKRGFQGRWKQALDDLGEQYDPRLVDSVIIHTVVSNSQTQITTTNIVGGTATYRTDNSTTKESKTGYMAVGSE